MRVFGKAFSYEKTGDRVSDAIITNTRVSIDWYDPEMEMKANLVADSTDGNYYRGNFGYEENGKTRLDGFRHVEFFRHDNRDGEVILIGKWWNTENNKKGRWMFHLYSNQTNQNMFLYPECDDV